MVLTRILCVIVLVALVGLAASAAWLAWRDPLSALPQPEAGAGRIADERRIDGRRLFHVGLKDPAVGGIGFTVSLPDPLPGEPLTRRRGARRARTRRRQHRADPGPRGECPNRFRLADAAAPAPRLRVYPPGAGPLRPFDGDAGGRSSRRWIGRPAGRGRTRTGSASSVSPSAHWRHRRRNVSPGRAAAAPSDGPSSPMGASGSATCWPHIRGCGPIGHDS